MNRPLTLTMIKELIPFFVLFGTMIFSYVSTNAVNDKNNALTNQKLDTVIMTQSSMNTQVNDYGDRIIRLETKQELGGKVTLENGVATMAAPLLTQIYGH